MPYVHAVAFVRIVFVSEIECELHVSFLFGQPLQAKQHGDILTIYGNAFMSNILLRAICALISIRVMVDARFDHYDSAFYFS